MVHNDFGNGGYDGEEELWEVEGEIKNNSELRLLRDGAVVYTGKVNSLFREKNEAKEVKAGLECGVSIKDFNDIKKGDVIEFFKTITIEREI